MRKRLSTWSRVFLVTVGTSAAAMVAGVFVVERFPWQTVYTDFSLARVSQFLTPWPQSALEEEMGERKRLKRYARPEVERRFQLQLRRMDLVRTPLFEPFLDAGTQLGLVGSSTAPQPALHFPWPSLQTARSVGEPGATRPVSYFVVPMVHGAHLVEGIPVAAGEEVRFSFPIVPNRRTLDFVALPLSPGTVRGTLGQYSWVRNFADSDVHRFQVISIPVNDTTASALRITSQSTRFLLLGAMVSQWDRNGRIPVQVSGRSPLWEADPELLRKGALVGSASGDAPVETAEGAAAPEGVAGAEASPEAGAAGAAGAEGAEGVVDAAAVVPEGATDTATGKETAGAAASAVEAAAPEAAPKDAKRGKEASKDDAKETALKTPDPLEETANPQALVRGARTAALGYNVLLLQLPPIPEEILSRPKVLAGVMPHLAGLLSGSVIARRGETEQDGARALFHRTILATGTESVATSTPVLLRKHLESPESFNLYARMRNFGYRVLSMAPAPFLGLPESIGAGREVPPLERRWLGASDWPFAQRNKELDEQSQPVSGLDAIFQTNTSPLAPPLGESELERVGAYLAEVGRVGDSFVDWRSNEIYLPDTEGLYLPSLVDFFQKWSKDNGQTRFLVHAYLDTGVGRTRPSMKDLFHVVKARKFSGLTSRDEAERLARLVLLDRSIHQILETLRARKLTHRTVVGVVMPHARAEDAGDPKDAKNAPRAAADGSSADARAHHVTAAVSIPGLKPKGTEPQGAGVDDLVATLLTAVGIPLGRNVPESFTGFPGGTWELPRGNETPARSPEPLGTLKRYVVYLRSGATGCAPLSWRTDEDVFGFEASHPVVEFGGAAGVAGRAAGGGSPGAGGAGVAAGSPGGTEHFRVFPCSLPGELVKLSWFQAKHRPIPVEERGQGDGGASLEPRVEPVAAERRRTPKPSAPPQPDPLEELSKATLRGFFSVRKSEGGATLDLPLFFFGRNALRLGALPMTLSSLDEREVARVFDVEEGEVPDARLAGDMLALSQFNGGTAALKAVASDQAVSRALAEIAAEARASAGASGASASGAAGAAATAGGEVAGGTAPRDRAALLVFRHGVQPETQGRFTRAGR